MDVKRRLVLKHESGLYLSIDPDSMPHTNRLSRARRFIDAEQISAFLQVSPYAPKNPGEYEIVQIKITYEEEEPNDYPQGGTPESQT